MRDLALSQFLKDACSVDGVFVLESPIVFKTIGEFLASHEMVLREKMKDVSSFE
jgi:hypothetical protein